MTLITSFNSTLVQLKDVTNPQAEIDAFMFQFYLSSIKRWYIYARRI